MATFLLFLLFGKNVEKKSLINPRWTNKHFMLLRSNDISDLSRIFRLNLINSISGIKPVNLIGTASKKGRENLAIFSSVVHLGSNPAQLGFVMRPQGEHLSDTFQNINDTGFYTINHVTESLVKKAHYTSAKLPDETSEFERMQIEKTFIDGFEAPFVKQSPVKIGMKHLENISLPNGYFLVIGEVVLLEVEDSSIDDKGQLDLSTHNGVGVSGLNRYYQLQLMEEWPYVRESEIPNFDE